MKKGIAHILLILLVLAVPVVVSAIYFVQIKGDTKIADAAVLDPNCWPKSGSELAGTLAGQPAAIWCYSDYSDGPGTVVKGNNSWVDDFNHGLSFGKFDTTNYSDFPITGSLCKSQLFRHANHWMRDIAGSDQGGEGSCGWRFGSAAMRPNATFQAENGKLVIEADVATRIASYRANFWPEFVITTGDRPTEVRRDGTYTYETFPNHWTLGCRLQNDGGFTCALLDDTNGGDSTARVFELSHFQCGNSENSPHPGSVYGCNSIYGGLPSNIPSEDAAYSRNCEYLDPDVNCRDRFRWEITNNRMTWFVNGKKYMEHTDFEPAARSAIDNLLNKPVFVYFGEFLYKLDVPARVHWDRIAINPKDASGNILSPTAAETFCLGQPLNTCGATTTPPVATAQPVSSPTPSPVPTPMQSPITDPSPSSTITFDDRATGLFSGVYPAGVMDWGTGNWYLSGPWGQFTTKSVSFNTSGITSRTAKLIVPATIKSLEAFNGGSGSSTVSVACSGNTTKTVIIPANTKVTITTGWTVNCTTVTFSSSNGWDTNFDNIVWGTGTTAPSPVPSSTTAPTTTTTVTFNDTSVTNGPLNGIYPSGLIDWGTNNLWYVSSPWKLFKTKSISFNSSVTKQAQFSFVGGSRSLVSLKAFNGGGTASTITLICTGNPNKVQAINPGQVVTITTGWTIPCSFVRVNSTNGWDTNFDDLVIR